MSEGRSLLLFGSIAMAYRRRPLDPVGQARQMVIEEAQDRAGNDRLPLPCPRRPRKSATSMAHYSPSRLRRQACLAGARRGTGAKAAPTSREKPQGQGVCAKYLRPGLPPSSFRCAWKAVEPGSCSKPTASTEPQSPPSGEEVLKRRRAGATNGIVAKLTVKQAPLRANLRRQPLAKAAVYLPGNEQRRDQRTILDVAGLHA